MACQLWKGCGASGTPPDTPAPAAAEQAGSLAASRASAGEQAAGSSCTKWASESMVSLPICGSQQAAVQRLLTVSIRYSLQDSLEPAAVWLHACCPATGCCNQASTACRSLLPLTCINLTMMQPRCLLACRLACRRGGAHQIPLQFPQLLTSGTFGKIHRGLGSDILDAECLALCLANETSSPLLNKEQCCALILCLCPAPSFLDAGACSWGEAKGARPRRTQQQRPRLQCILPSAQPFRRSCSICLVQSSLYVHLCACG